MTQSVRERAITFASENPTSVASGYILTLADDLSKAVEALKVFADDYAHMGYDNTNTDEQELDEGPSRLTVGDLRRARAAYNHLTRDKG